MTDTRLHFYFNEDNYSYEGSHSICVDNGEENIIYVIYDREESVFADIINNESNETTNYFEAVDIYSLDNDEFGDFNNILSSENSLETVMEYIEEYPSLTLLGTLDYSGIVTGEMIEEFYIGELESSHSALITNNKTVSSLYIHNKEVQSIITSDNVVLYEKENSVTPVVSEPYSISLSASKYILSEHDTDTCVLSATVTDENNNACSNQTVTFKSDNTILGTAITDNNGVTTYTYNSQGIGDVCIGAETNNLSSNSILIEDCMYFKEEEVSYVSTYTDGRDHSIRFDDNLSLVLTDDFEFSMDCKANMNGARLQLSSISGASSSTSNYGFGFNRDGGGTCPYYRDTSSLAWGTKISNDTNYHSLKFVRNGDTFTAYLDNTNKGNQTFTWWNNQSPFSLYWWVWKSGTITAKNIKIKKIIYNISPVNILDNVSFTHSDGTTSRNVSYINNESTTMSVQGLKDVSTPAINGEIDFLLGTGEDYRDITLTPNVEYDFTGHDFDIIQLRHTCAPSQTQSILRIGNTTIVFNYVDDYHLANGRGDEEFNYKVKDNKLYCCNVTTRYTTLSNLKTTAYVNNIIVRVYNCMNYSLIDTQRTNNQGYASYEYEATGQGEFYIKAQSHEDSTISTDSYLISDWIYKDFTNYGGWSAFSGRNTSSMSISDNTLRVTSGNKGGAHSVNTIFNLPNDDYEVSFKITETTKTDSNGVRIGIHSANYSDHHEKACCGIAYVGGTGNKISFDYSNNNVTAVTKEVIADNLTVGDIIRFRVEGTTLKCYHNDSLYVTETLAWLHDPMWLYAQSWGTGTANISITDFRVKRIINN